MLSTDTTLQPFSAVQNCLTARPGSDMLAVLASGHQAVLLRQSDTAVTNLDSSSDSGSHAASRDGGSSGSGSLRAHAVMRLGFGANNGVCCAAWDASGIWLAVGTAQQLHLFHCGSSGGDVTPVGCTQLRFTPKDVAVSARAADGKVVLAAGGAVGLAVFEAEPQAETAGGSSVAQDWQLRRVCTLAGRLPVCAAAFGGKSDGGGDGGGAAASLAAACLDGSLFIWDLRDTQLSAVHSRLALQACAFGQRVTSLAFSPDGTALAVGAWGGLFAVFRRSTAPTAAGNLSGCAPPAAGSSDGTAGTAATLASSSISDSSGRGSQSATPAAGGSSDSRGLNGARSVDCTNAASSAAVGVSSSIAQMPAPNGSIPLEPSPSGDSRCCSTSQVPALNQAPPQPSPDSPSKRNGRRRKPVEWQVLQAPATPGTGAQWGLAAIAEGDPAPLRPEAAPPTLLAWVGRSGDGDDDDDGSGAGGGGRCGEQAAAAAGEIESWVVCRRGGPPVLCSTSSTSNDLEFEPLPGTPQASFSLQPHSSSMAAATTGAATAAVGPWAPAPMSVADWNAAAEPEDDTEAPESQAGGCIGIAAAGPASQRVWPAADAPSDMAPELPEQFAGLLRLGGVASPPQQDSDAAQQEVTTPAAWNAFVGAHARCRRTFPCPADAPQPALVRGLAVCGCRGSDGGLRRGVAWLDSAGVLSFLPLIPG